MNRTFSLRNVSLSSSLNFNMSERIALMSREIIRNAVEHKAGCIQGSTVFYQGKRYLHLAHDGEPFSSLAYLKECLTPNTSGNNSGVQGSGMKTAMFLGADTEHAEIIIHSRNKDKAFSASLTCKDANNAQIDERKDLNSFVKKLYGEHYAKFNVFVFYRVQENKVLYDEKNIALLRDLCQVEDITFRFIHNMSIGDSLEKNNKNIVTVKSGADHHRIRKDLSSLDRKRIFLIDSHTLWVKDIDYPDPKIGIKFNARVDIEVYPGFKDQNGRYINLDTNSKDFGTGATYTTISNQSLFVYYDREVIENRQKGNKNISRLRQDPVFTSVHAHGLLAEIGLSCPKGKEFIDKLENYKYIPGGINGRKKILDATRQWSPIVKINVTICEHPSFSPVSLPGFLSYFGPVDEFFFIDNIFVRENIVRSIFQKLGQEDPDELKSIRKKMQHHFPFDRKNKLPIPIEKYNENKTIYVYEATKGGDWQKKTKVEPGESLRKVKLVFGKDNRPVNINITQVYGGIKLERKNNNIFDIFVEDLARIDDKGEIIPIEESEYLHSPHFIPRKTFHVDIEGVGYRLGLICSVPPKPKRKTSQVRQHREKIGDNALSYNKYINANPEEYGIFTSKYGLQINEDNITMRQIIFNDPQEYPWILKEWENIYKDLENIAREAVHEYSNEIQVGWNREKADVLREKYSDEFSYYMNKGKINVYVKHNQRFQEFLQKIRKETGGKDAPDQNEIPQDNLVSRTASKR